MCIATPLFIRRIRLYSVWIQKMHAYADFFSIDKSRDISKRFLFFIARIRNHPSSGASIFVNSPIAFLKVIRLKIQLKIGMSEQYHKSINIKFSFEWMLSHVPIHHCFVENLPCLSRDGSHLSFSSRYVVFWSNNLIIIHSFGMSLGKKQSISNHSSYAMTYTYKVPRKSVAWFQESRRFGLWDFPF